MRLGSRRSHRSAAQQQLLARVEQALAIPERPSLEEGGGVERFCALLARSAPQADEAFRERLEAELKTRIPRQREITPAQETTTHRRQWLRIRWWKAGFVAAAALLGCLVLVGPVLGQIPPWRHRLQHVTVHDVTQLPAPNHIDIGTPAAGRRWVDLGTLAQQAGFTPRVPATLPNGCTAQERWYAVDSHEVSLVYSCAVVAEQLAAGNHQDPNAPATAVQDVTVNGLPALYIQGAWVGPLGSPPVWRDNGMGMLVFEDRGLIIRVTGHRTRDELVRIAESLR